MIRLCAAGKGATCPARGLLVKTATTAGIQRLDILRVNNYFANRVIGCRRDVDGVQANAGLSAMGVVSFRAPIAGESL